MIYYPEMQQQPAPRLFHSRHVYGGAYAIEWAPANDEAVRALLKQLKIRPRSIELCRVGIELIATAKADKYTAIVTGAAHRKLLKTDVTACEVLLD